MQTLAFYSQVYCTRLQNYKTTSIAKLEWTTILWNSEKHNYYLQALRVQHGSSQVYIARLLLDDQGLWEDAILVSS